MRAALFLVLSLSVFVVGCGGGSQSQTLSGNWQLSLTNSATGAVKSESGFLAQSGSSLSGSFLLTGQTACPGVGAAQGKVSGSDISLALQQVGETINLQGKSTSSGGSQSASMNGSYSILSSPCGFTQVGTFTGTQIKPLTGNLKAVFTSILGTGSIVNFTGSISQAQSNGSSAADLSGTMSTSDSTCLPSATIGGQISGTAVVLNLLSKEGVAVGQYLGTATADATTVTGTYNLFPQAPPGGCHDYGSGTITLSGSGS